MSAQFNVGRLFANKVAKVRWSASDAARPLFYRSTVYLLVYCIIVSDFLTANCCVTSSTLFDDYPTSYRPLIWSGHPFLIRRRSPSVVYCRTVQCLAVCGSIPSCCEQDSLWPTSTLTDLYRSWWYFWSSGTYPGPPYNLIITSAECWPTFVAAAWFPSVHSSFQPWHNYLTYDLLTSFSNSGLIVLFRPLWTFRFGVTVKLDWYISYYVSITYMSFCWMFVVLKSSILLDYHSQLTELWNSVKLRKYIMLQLQSIFLSQVSMFSASDCSRKRDSQVDWRKM